LKTQVKRFIASERGSVESAMVLIPLLFLFLCGAQLTSTIFIRNFELAKVQSEASTRAISNDLRSDDSIIQVTTPDRFHDLRILVVRKQRELPIIVPGLASIFGGSLKSEVIGVAVMETAP
jgi:hypothetical protein